MKITMADISVVGIFSAVAFAGAYLLIPFHNIEIFTAIIFLSGVLFGERNGMLVGFIASSLYAIFNPFGISPPPLFVAQVLSRALVGYVGGRFGKLPLWKHHFWFNAIYFGITGFILTWVYIILALFSGLFTSGFSLEQMKVSFALGIVSYSILSIGNMLIFGLVLPLIVQGLRNTTYFKRSNLS